MSEIVNYDRLIAKLRRLSSDKLGDDIVRRGVHNSLKNIVQPQAKLLAPVNNGELRRNIKTRVEMDGDKAIGIMYNNSEHAQYVEFGTGPKGAADHLGISPEVSISYRTEPWYVHKDQIDVGPYRFQEVGDFYKMYGQVAQPFMYPALKDNGDRVTKNIGKYVNRKLKEVSK